MARFVQCDVTNKEQLEGAISDVAKQNGRLDVLCNNAAISGLSNDVEKIVHTNLTAVIQATTIALQYMDNTKGGHGGNIVNISSLGGLKYTEGMYTMVGHSSYCAAKSGVVFYTRIIAEEALKVGVRVNCICPSCVETDGLKEVLLTNPFAKQFVETVGWQSVDMVAKGFMELLNDDMKVGKVMRITVQNGIDYHLFPEEEIPM